MMAFYARRGLGSGAPPNADYYYVFKRIDRHGYGKNSLECLYCHYEWPEGDLVTSRGE